MPTYVFKGRIRLNEVVSGERAADSREALRQILRREQVTLTSVKEKGREIGIPKLSGRRKVKSKDLAIFTRQFSVMIDAGLPLVQCLDILAQQQQNKYFQQVLGQIRQDVEEGSTLAAAMARRDSPHARAADRAPPSGLPAILDNRDAVGSARACEVFDPAAHRHFHKKHHKPQRGDRLPNDPPHGNPPPTRKAQV